MQIYNLTKLIPSFWYLESLIYINCITTQLKLNSLSK